MVDLKTLATQHACLPGKIRWYIHLRCQSLLLWCSEARHGQVDSDVLAWGGIVHGSPLALMATTKKRTWAQEPSTQCVGVINLRLVWWFCHGEEYCIEDL